jgi:hypothetical protein
VTPAATSNDCTNPLIGGCDCNAFGAFGPCAPNGTCTGNPSLFCKPTCQELGLGTCQPFIVTREFKFDSPGQSLAASTREVMAAPKSNVITQLCPEAAACTLPAGFNPSAGICPGSDQGEPGIQHQGQPFSVSMAKGDTVKVSATRFDTVPPGLTVTGPVVVSANVQLDGVLVDPEGTTETSASTAESINFSVTTR